MQHWWLGRGCKLIYIFKYKRHRRASDIKIVCEYVKSNGIFFKSEKMFVHFQFVFFTGGRFNTTESNDFFIK